MIIIIIIIDKITQRKKKGNTLRIIQCHGCYHRNINAKKDP